MGSMSSKNANVEMPMLDSPKDQCQSWGRFYVCPLADAYKNLRRNIESCSSKKTMQDAEKVKVKVQVALMELHFLIVVQQEIRAPGEFFCTSPKLYLQILRISFLQSFFMCFLLYSLTRLDELNILCNENKVCA